jgi:hypothetical protein
MIVHSLHFDSIAILLKCATAIEGIRLKSLRTKVCHCQHAGSDNNIMYDFIEKKNDTNKQRLYKNELQVYISFCSSFK